MTSLTGRIKVEARRLGFQMVGVTSPDPPPHLAVFERWLAAGRHGEMAYLATDRSRQRRADPREILPECRSILVVGLRYPSPGPAFGPEKPGHSSQPERLEGRVASYAWGEDYHDLLPERLAALVAFIEREAGRPVPNRWYTDTGPVLERDLAQRAGLGWIGKNTCLITPGQGSYFLLAEVLLGLELDPDPPFLADFCGSCTRCIDACPTGCILPDRTLDAKRCISYLTIELKGPIPDDLRPRLGEWVFGCDICQEVCPWNRRFAPQDGEAERRAAETFTPRPGAGSVDLPGELSLTPQEFNRRYRSSPLRRVKRRGYLRNVAVALGNLLARKRSPRAEAALEQALRRDPEPLVRMHAAWALGQAGSDEARQALVAAGQVETNPEVLSEIRLAISRIPTE